MHGKGGKKDEKEKKGKNVRTFVSIAVRKVRRCDSETEARRDRKRKTRQDR